MLIFVGTNFEYKNILKYIIIQAFHLLFENKIHNFFNIGY